MPAPKVFIDSGAHSVNTLGIDIDIFEYISFIQQNMDAIDVYANLDVITAQDKRLPDRESAELTLQNQRKMEDAGLNPMPVFHRGEPPEYLEHYCQNYEYVGIGTGPATGSKNLLLYWLDEVFEEYICGSDGMPKVKTHGFGIGNFDVIKRYPWYSVDSTTWIQYAAYGQILVPLFRDGKWSYNDRPFLVRVSSRRSKNGKRSVARMPNHVPKKQLTMRYLNEKGFKLGEFKWEGNEEIVEQGDCNSFEIRSELNALYYLEFISDMVFYFAGNGSKAEEIVSLKQHLNDNWGILRSYKDLKNNCKELPARRSYQYH